MIEGEARDLLGLANEIMVKRPQSAPALAAWREKVFSFLDAAKPNDIVHEAKLEQLSLELRAIWMQIAHDHTGHHLKSPLEGSAVVFPLGREAELKYERIMSSIGIEDRCKTYRPRVPGWANGHLLFRSGMAAIASLIQNLRPHFFEADHEQIRVDFFGGYYETQRIFDLYASSLIRFDRRATGEDLYQKIENGGGHVLFLEPVSYDWDMEVLDFKRVLDALKKRQQPPRMIVLDTTIVGHTFPVKSFIEALQGVASPIVVQISSGLKLDQEGLEFSNVGIFSLYCKDDGDRNQGVQDFLDRIAGNRKINGTALSAYEIAALDIPCFLNRERFEAHSRAIFESNKRLARTLAPVVASADGVFEKVSHPCLGAGADWPWAVAPFVVFHFREAFDNERTHEGIKRALLKHSKHEGVSFFGTGMSFGFRSHRFEIILPKRILHPNGSAKGLLKVAMGRRQGPMANAVIELMKRVAMTKPGG